MNTQTEELAMRYERRRLERRYEEALDDLEIARLRYGRAERALGLAREIASVSPRRGRKALAKAGAELAIAMHELYVAEAGFTVARLAFDAALPMEVAP